MMRPEPAHHRRPLFRRQSRAGGLFDGARHAAVRALLIPFFEPAEPDMGEVLEPLEVGHDYTARVGVDIGDDQHPLLLEDGVGRRRRWTVGAFWQDPSSHPRRVVLGNLKLERRRQQHVTVELESVERVRQVGGPREVQYRPAGSSLLPESGAGTSTAGPMTFLRTSSWV
jgi:hypothetical protein